MFVTNDCYFYPKRLKKSTNDDDEYSSYSDRVFNEVCFGEIEYKLGN